MKKIIIIIGVALFLIQKSKAQNSPEIPTDSVVREFKTEGGKLAQELLKKKPGLDKDILPNLYQLALKNVFGKDGELSFTSSIFGIFDSLASSKLKILNPEDTLFSKLQWARNIFFSINGKMDSTNRISTFGGGLTFAIINKRDINISDKKMNKTLAQIETKIVDIRAKIKAKITEGMNENDREKKLEAIDKSYDEFRVTKNPDKLDPEFRQILHNDYNITAEKDFFFESSVLFEQRKEQLKTNPLWTLGFDYKRNTVLRLDTTTFKSDFVVGIRNKNDPEGKKPWEITASSALKLFNSVDSSATQKSTKAFHFEAGLNKILLADDDGSSNMELKLFAGLDKDFAIKGNKATITANSTFRYKAFGDFWIPITLSYDPKKGTVFGFATLTFNLDKYSKKQKPRS